MEPIRILIKEVIEWRALQKKDFLTNQGVCYYDAAYNAFF